MADANPQVQNPGKRSADALANDGRWMIETLTGHFAEVIETMTGERPSHEFEIAEDAPEEPAADTLVCQQMLRLPAEGLAWLVAGREVWHAIGSRILQAAGVNDGDEETIRGTLLEIANQTVSALARSLSARLGSEVSTEPAREAAGLPELMRWFTVVLGFGETRVGPLWVAFDHQLIAALEAPRSERELVVAEDASIEAAAGGPGSGSAAAAAAVAAATKTGSLDLLLDVELPVSVSFGRAQLPLKDVIKLTSGSIVELNRTVSEPVEVIVNNCVIARGEVVVVEGNFGVRILQVVSRQERLRTLD